jgi:hypothetical protein
MAAGADQFYAFNLVHLPTPAELEQQRLDRLLELRAVIESLRSEQARQDPLLTWAIAQEGTRTP